MPLHLCSCKLAMHQTVTGYFVCEHCDRPCTRGASICDQCRDLSRVDRHRR